MASNQLFIFSLVILSARAHGNIPSLHSLGLPGHPLPYREVMPAIFKEPTSTKFVCPPKKKIAPCECKEENRWASCSGTKVNQTSIDNFFKQFRSTNKVGTKDWLQMPFFSITETSLTRMDATFFKTNFSSLTIVDNQNLSQFISSSTRLRGGPPTSDPTFIATNLDLSQNSLSDSGVAGILNQIDKSQLKTLAVMHNKLTSVVTGLADMVQLTWLSLDNNQIFSVSGNQFEANQNLVNLYLRNNKMTRLGPNAFAFNNTSSSEYAFIYLENNNLDGEQQTNIDDSALSGITRPTRILLDGNGLATMASSKFKQFLDNGNINSLSLHKNKFQCHGKMAWLKKQRSDYEYRVFGARCENDRGKTVFTSTKVDED